MVSKLSGGDGKGIQKPKKLDYFSCIMSYICLPIIDPQHSKAMTYWDAVTTTALIYTALVTPYEVGFLQAAEDPADTLFIINQLLTVIFVIDIVLQFSLMYPAPATPTKPAGWVSDRRRICVHYLTTWFTLDVVSVGVSGFDYISLCVGTAAECAQKAEDSLSDLRVLRVLRALRLIKLVRLVRVSRIFDRWEARMAINYAMLHILTALLQTLLVSHWFACIWGLQVPTPPLVTPPLVSPPTSRLPPLASSHLSPPPTFRLPPLASSLSPHPPTRPSAHA